MAPSNKYRAGTPASERTTFAHGTNRLSSASFGKVMLLKLFPLLSTVEQLCKTHLNSSKLWQRSGGLLFRGSSLNCPFPQRGATAQSTFVISCPLFRGRPQQQRRISPFIAMAGLLHSPANTCSLPTGEGGLSLSGKQQEIQAFCPRPTFC